MFLCTVMLMMYEAWQLYVEAFPSREILSDKLFLKLHQRLSKNGLFNF